MRYTAFRFKNFKGIESMDLALTGSVTTLIGLNESGKTTVLEAIFCFSYGAEDLQVINPGMASLRVPERWIPISKQANFNDTIEIAAKVSLTGADQKALRAHMKSEFGLRLSKTPDELVITEKYHFENSRHSTTERLWALEVVGTSGQQRKPRRAGFKSEEWQGAVSFLKTRLPRIWYFPNFLFELPERFALSDEPTSAGDEEHDKSLFYRGTFEQILTELGYGANLQTHVVERLGSAERADQRGLAAVLLDMGRLMTSTIFDGWDRIFSRKPTAQEVEITADDVAGKPYLELKIKGPDGYYDLSERSLGFRWFFMFLLMTQFHSVGDDGPPSLFLLDEPASNLHSTAQAELLKSFEKLIENCDLVYTTHSHHLIDVRWLDSAFVVKNAALGTDFSQYLAQRVGAHTSISATPYRRFVAEHPDQTSYFQPVLDVLAYQPSHLEPVPDVVMIEGKSDFYLLRYASEILGVDDSLRLLPGTGSGALAPLIRLHIAWGKSFVVLLDGDREGIKQKDRYEKEFGPVLTGRCVLLPELVGDAAAKEIEHLLEEGDRRLLIDSVFDDGPRPGPKKALYQAVSELYARRETVSLDPKSRTRLSAVFIELASLLQKQQPMR